jgi:hypothetical protein
MDQLHDIKKTLNHLDKQMGLFQSHFESEKGNITRQLNEANEKLDNIQQILYDPKDGLMFLADRLKQREKKRDAIWLWVMGLLAAVIGLAIKVFSTTSK